MRCSAKPPALPSTIFWRCSRHCSWPRQYSGHFREPAPIFSRRWNPHWAAFFRRAYNVGAFFRTADAAGVQKLYLCGITAYPPKRAIAKTALGAQERVAWEHPASALSALETLRDMLRTLSSKTETGKTRIPV
jgi:hypothetical protein